MKLWKDDNELFAIARNELFTALVGDSLDKMGLLHQFLPQGVKPLSPGMTVIGRAMPVLEADVGGPRFVAASDGTKPVPPADGTKPVPPDKPFGLMFEALDSLRPGEVYICSGASPRYALWGGLMSTRAMKCGAAGAVVDGFSRDTPEILRLGFPVFSLGTYAQDQGPRGKVIDYRIPIEFGGIRIEPGDIVYGDVDGTLVVPRAAVEEAFSLAIEKARGEKNVLKALQEGMTTVDAFAKFGIM